MKKACTPAANAVSAGPVLQQQQQHPLLQCRAGQGRQGRGASAGGSHRAWADLMTRPDPRDLPARSGS